MLAITPVPHYSGAVKGLRSSSHASAAGTSFIYLAYVRGAGETEALSFGLQALSTASKNRVYGEPMSVLPAALRNWKYKDQEVSFNHTASANHPGGKQTL